MHLVNAKSAIQAAANSSFMTTASIIFNFLKGSSTNFAYYISPKTNVPDKIA